jgi:hypothetical protein
VSVDELHGGAAAAAGGNFRRVLVENPAEQRIIQRISRSTTHFQTLADQFNKEGLRKRGRKWTAAMIRSIQKK